MRAVLISTILGTGLLLSLGDGAFGQTGTPAPAASAAYGRSRVRVHSGWRYKSYVEPPADGEPVLRSPVVVGKRATPTPELTVSIVAIRFNPDWTSTPRMVRNE